MVQLRGLLYRQIKKYERPKSLFGKLPYLKEQALIRQATDQIAQGMFFYSPIGLGIRSPFPVEKLPKDFRRKKALQRFANAKKKLEQVLP